MTNKYCKSVSCVLSSCCQTAEFQNTCPNRFERFRKGQTLYDADSAVFIILSGIGLVSIALGFEEQMQLALLGKGHIFGILTPFSEVRLKDTWDLSLRPLTDMEVCKIPCLGLRHYTKQHPSLLYNIIVASKGVVRSAMRQMWINSPRKIYDRVLRALVVLNELYGRDLTISHDDMALIVNADRPSVTLALDKLRDEGFVSLEYRRIGLNESLTSCELEITLKPDYDRLSMLPSLIDQNDGHSRRSPDLRPSLGARTH